MKEKIPDEKIKNLVSGLPETPGIYQFFDSAGRLIYVGKAKNLKKRVSSYFNKTHDSRKLHILVSKIADIRPIIVDTELEALLLENNLIKKHQPRYNVQLKDDKTFPWICIKKERFPRIFPTRALIKDGSQYFGPYASVRIMKTMLDLIRQLYKLRTCKYNLTQENIDNNKFKMCLEFHLGNCLAPCIGKQDEDEYNDTVSEIKSILKGDLHSVASYLKQRMNRYAAEYKFEEAQKIKEKTDILEKFQSRSTVVNPAINNVDVFSMTDNEQFAFVNYIKVINGAVIQGHTIEMKKKIEETREDLLAMAIIDIRQRFESESHEIIVPFDPGFELPDATFIIPQRGDKKKILELSERNAKYYRQERLVQIDKANPFQKVQRLLETIKADLRLPGLPVHIECFDNSNIQGANPVAACVVFKNTKPCKREYRHFNIKSVEGPDDFASMEEIVLRRYKRLLDEKQELPQLIIIDGGKGQLSAAVKSIEALQLRGKIAIIGIAKRLEEIYFPGDPVPLYLNKNSETLKVIQHIRNEAHHFGISFHRTKRSKDFIKSELDIIGGIGDKTKQSLLTKMKSIEKIKAADMDALEKIAGKAKAKLIFEYFHK
ncbi:MAG: excinuclease ABC subunit UvrC [Bacteroidia bacterium]|nr:excinuclease ABC subunit UvrC [Bacteroidia bacterium]